MGIGMPRCWEHVTFLLRDSIGNVELPLWEVKTLWQDFLILVKSKYKWKWLDLLPYVELEKKRQLGMDIQDGALLTHAMI